MIIKFKNYTKKKRSTRIKKELIEFSLYMAKEFEIDQNIKSLTFEFRNDWIGYYPKGKPLGGFRFMLSNGHMRIVLTKFWDINQKARKEAVVHEMTHAKQILTKKLVVVKDKDIVWANKNYDKWKKFRFNKYVQIKNIKVQKEYLEKHFPWEQEVNQNIKRYNS